MIKPTQVYHAQSHGLNPGVETRLEIVPENLKESKLEIVDHKANRIIRVAWRNVGPGNVDCSIQFSIEEVDCKPRWRVKYISFSVPGPMADAFIESLMFKANAG